MTKAVGIIDEPVAPGATDNLDINIHSKSLIDFISDTSTPITVGIQGEWGSGKTSLINSIHHSFDSHGDFKQIWINSWEYSLLSTPEEALLKIVNRIIDDLVAQDTNKKRLSSIKSGAESIFKGALRVGAGMTMGMEAANVAKELLETSEQTISALRQQLSDVVNESKFKKIIIYVDDLDRIEPRNAVAILELLKNIFSVPRCVFILAIDYQVVVKGLEHKFGKQTAQNEWEFRAFFDKIIQLPFMMPMGQYNIGKYVNSLLVNIGFVEEPGLDDEAVRQIILQTIGGNPRSIKRLANSVSLILLFIQERKKFGGDTNKESRLGDETEKMLMFSLLCLQIAFPAIYSLLNQEPNFLAWDEKFAFKQTNRVEERLGDLKPEEMKQIFQEEFNAAKETEDFDEEWEQALYRICYSRPRLKPRVIDISKFFSYLLDDLLSAHKNHIGDILSETLSQTSVTNVESTDQGQIGEMNAKSKYLDTSQQDVLINHSVRLFAELKKAGSIVFGSQNRVKNITGWTRMRKKGIYKDPDLNPLWIVCFNGYLEVNFGKDFPAEVNLDLVRYIEAQIVNLNKILPGDWQVDWKEGRSNKNVSLTSEHINDIGWNADSLSKTNETNREQTIRWLKQTVPVFEKAIIDLCNDYFDGTKGT